MSLSNDTKLLLMIAELEIKWVCRVSGLGMGMGSGIEEAEYALCCQSNHALDEDLGRSLS